MAYTEAQKRAIYKYKETHPEKVKEQQAKNMKAYYEKNRERILNQKRDKRMLSKIESLEELII